MTVYRPGPDIGVIDTGDRLFVAQLPAGPITVLDGTASVVWRAACAGGTGSVAERAAEHVDRSADEIALDVEAFLDDMLARGFLISPLAPESPLGL